MIYGATGRTGKLIAELAVRRGHRPVLAGRSAAPVQEMAERLDLPWAAFPAGEQGALAGVKLVLNAAGPFPATSGPLLDGCLENGTHYLDIANEIPVVEAVLDRHLEAKRRGIGLVSGVGLGPVLTDSVARYVADQLPGAVRLELAFFPYLDGESVGTRNSVVELLAADGFIRRDGALKRHPAGAGARRMATPEGTRTLIPMPLGDLVTSHWTTGIPDITVYAAVPAPAPLAGIVLPVLQRVARSPRLSRLLATSSEPTGADPSRRSYAWARAVTSDGREAEAWMETGEGYAFTAEASIQAVEGMLADPATGALTIAGAFGADFALGVGDTRRHDGALST